MSVRGDVTVNLGGKDYRLLLTLGAMAAIEDRLKVDNINEAIGKVVEQNASSILVMVSEAAKAGGNPLSDEELGAMDYLDVTGGLGELIKKAFADPDADEAEGVNGETCDQPEKN